MGDIPREIIRHSPEFTCRCVCIDAVMAKPPGARIMGYGGETTRFRRCLSRDESRQTSLFRRRAHGLDVQRQRQ